MIDIINGDIHGIFFYASVRINTFYIYLRLSVADNCFIFITDVQSLGGAHIMIGRSRVRIPAAPEIATGSLLQRFSVFIEVNVANDLDDILYTSCMGQRLSYLTCIWRYPSLGETC